MIKILVIENEEQARNMFLTYLEEKGFDAISAKNGVVGVQLAQENLPDLIISEIIMPKLDGYGILRALRENLATAIIPLIFVTAKVSQADIRKGIELGADDYLTKPCTPEELLRAIRARLEKQALLQKCYAAQFQPHLKSSSTETTNLSTSQLIFPTDSQLSKVFNFIEANYHRQKIREFRPAIAAIGEAQKLPELLRSMKMRALVRTGHAPQNLSLLRRIALNALPCCNSSSVVIVKNPIEPLWITNYMLTILAACLSHHNDTEKPCCQ